MAGSFALVQYLRFFKGSVDFHKWQNYFIGQAVDGYDYQGFRSSGVLTNRSSDENGVSIEMPANPSILGMMETAIGDQWLCESIVYRLTDPTSAATKVVASRFIGEVLGVSTDMVTIKFELGAGIDALTAQIPGRKITSALVGSLPQI
jgi:hypothetical protein